MWGNSRILFAFLMPYKVGVELVRLFSFVFSTNGSTSIDLPYAAFDLWIGSPFYGNTTRYFPIRCATDPSQYAIGRTILPGAYLIVDHERRNFNLSPTIFSDPMPIPDIRTIYPGAPAVNKNDTASVNSARSGIPLNIIVGMPVCAISALLLIAGTWFLWRRHRKQDKDHPLGGRHELGTEKMGISKKRPEAGGDEINEMEVPQHEMDGDDRGLRASC